MALEQLGQKDVAFWLEVKESQLWLDEERYLQYVEMKKELA